MEAFITYRQALPLPDNAEGTPAEMSDADFAKFLDLVSGSGLEHCLLCGNEPTLHSAFPDFVAQAQKHKLLPVVETTGRIAPAARELIQKAQLPVRWRVYHPECYDPAIWTEIRETCAGLRQATGDKLLAHLIVHDTALDYTPVIEVMEELDIALVTFQALHPIHPGALRPFTSQLVGHAIRLMDKGIGVGMDCGWTPCLFADEDFGALAKRDVRPRECQPQPGVLPDARIYHCRRMLAAATDDFRRFTDLNAIRDFLFEYCGDLNRDTSIFTECRTCLNLYQDTCHGPCMATKRAWAEREDKALQNAAGTASASKEEPLRRYARRGALYWKLRRLDDAEACLMKVLAEGGSLPAATLAGARLLLARVWRSAGETDSAEREFRQAAESPACAESAWRELSAMLRQLGREEDAKRAGEAAAQAAARTQEMGI